MFNVDGLTAILPGEILNYRVGFNVYADVVSEAEVSSFSNDLGALIPAKQSPYGKYTYPYDFASGEYTLVGGNDSYEMEGYYRMTLISPQQQILQFSTTLNAINGAALQNNRFY